MDATTADLTAFVWSPQPAAAGIIERILRSATERCVALSRLGARLRDETGTRLVDYVDHVHVEHSDRLESELAAAGFTPSQIDARPAWHHPAGLFPTVYMAKRTRIGVALRVESLADFLLAQQLQDCRVEGAPRARLRKAKIFEAAEIEVWAVERHAERGWEIKSGSDTPVEEQALFYDAFLLRRRRFGSERTGLEHTLKLVRQAVARLDPDLACDLFFAAERAYWQSRNRAAQLQRMRQDALGLGWSNHDHHTYRASREHFAPMIRILEELGMVCRERFYAGGQAGWGAQVLEQPTAGVIVFADVDLSPDEVAGDFAHQGLAPRDRLGTVGLWCRLHGESILQAGMHHLEGQFDFDAARTQLKTLGVGMMPPFTDFPFLKQAFTEGETWAVDQDRIDAALAEGLITREQADQFAARGAIGSHLEILERNDGYKGFNQTGISEIIAATDPRRQQ